MLLYSLVFFQRIAMIDVDWRHKLMSCKTIKVKYKYTEKLNLRENKSINIKVLKNSVNNENITSM